MAKRAVLKHRSHHILNIFFIAIVFASLMLPLISAYGFIDLRYGMEQVIQWIKDFTGPFFETILNTRAYEEFFFAKVLLLFLLFIVITFTLDVAKIFGTLQEKRGVIYTIAAAVSILAMRYLPESDLIRGILLPYSALGVAITTFLPLIIYFFFIHNSNFGGYGRRAGWILYGIVFIALWLSKDVQLSDTSNWIYWSALIFVIASLIFDKSIHRYFAFSDIRGFSSRINRAHINDLKLRIAELKSHSNWQNDRTIRNEIIDLEKALRKAGTRLES